MNKIKKNIIWIPIVTAIISTLVLGYISFGSKANHTKQYSSFLEDITSNNISKVIVTNNSNLTVFLKDGSKYSTNNPDSPTLKEELLKNNIEVLDQNSTSPTKTVASSILLISIISIVFVTINKRKLGTSSMTNLDVKDFSEDQNALNFDYVAGNEEAKESLMDIVDFLKNPQKYKDYGARMPKGVILYGSPGTGKTLLAKAVAGEAKVPFYALSGSDFVQVYVGVGAARIRNLFKKAKAQGKAVIFIDEIDAIGKKRGGSSASSGNDERDQTLNALLTEMSGFGEQEGIVVIAATNRLDTLDSALLRPGRFDRHIEVSLPDISAREKIISLHLENKPYNNLDLKDIAKKTAYFSGAKLENLINEAAIIAAKENSRLLTQDHINKAYSIVLAGYEKKERSHYLEEDMLLTSYHEAGHALVSLIKTPEDKVSKITIIPTTKGAGGYTLTIPKDSSYQRLDYLKNRIMVLLGGRAAEEIIFGQDKISTGAQGDLSQTTEMAMSMISEYGMGKTLGLLKLSSLGPLSNSYGNPVVEECRELVNSLYGETLELLKENKEILNKIAMNLIDEETLDEKEIYSIFNKKLSTENF
ncbi:MULTISPECIES: ATP-dependent metallopeptidase FtsH/Yme1/Tma family protein [Clostridium]|uniref:ATP-dependent zinc metalloprotease FtsH n=1 Tax=Clostridium tertium TaxID=1559 RepID=A0A9X3XM14_9CLOT|nr:MULTISPECIES: FtsH/Yme1/Tma family ATP-dependent metallopeptidase [Clostridium]EEH99109.1 ATP-dependent metallopeptidase HflB [Clostridium sp. 7_2_43FAA]MDB1934832.1 ATP-dependent metallopeptidase FtsH/Yme1/Tma family protein [Clostridium tertium]MDB1937981.1 ATP-dependent metallopeptidase FtsH/Yme1/Tma family protein [Clostridium tertium]MDB1940124.1 ATP-dependent metallopeptidase FtsH/Yme1/Tma family protein [Clostridium tertium]MDB1945734.1 ATP-dependent metallopeptidase FtsH/Yme1/Tma fa